MKESIKEAPEALLIINGKGAGNEMLREAIYALRSEGVALAVRVTWEHGDAARYVHEAIELGCETVIAGGAYAIKKVSRWMSRREMVILFTFHCLKTSI